MIGSALLYYLVVYPLSLLPMPMLYGIGSFLHFMLYHVTGYRKKVVYQNLKNSFPEKSEDELKKIMRQFYRHLTDLIVESVKIFSISEKQVNRRMKILNPEVLEPFFQEGRSIILVGGHYNSWEMYALAADAAMSHKGVAIYKELKNKFWDKKMRASRQAFGLKMIPTYSVAKFFQEQHDHPTATIFGGDQSPSSVRKVHWVDFLNQDTAVLTGTERYAVQYNLPVVFGVINKVKRGHYEVEYRLITDQPQSHPEGEITEMHTKALEEVIVNDPQYWLWSHKRWKRKRSEINE